MHRLVVSTAWSSFQRSLTHRRSVVESGTTNVGLERSFFWQQRWICVYMICIYILYNLNLKKCLVLQDAINNHLNNPPKKWKFVQTLLIWSPRGDMDNYAILIRGKKNVLDNYASQLWPCSNVETHKLYNLVYTYVYVLSMMSIFLCLHAICLTTFLSESSVMFAEHNHVPNGPNLWATCRLLLTRQARSMAKPSRSIRTRDSPFGHPYWQTQRLDICRMMGKVVKVEVMLKRYRWWL